MANFQLYNDKVWTLPVKCFNPNTSTTTAGFPSGTTVTAASSLPNSLGVAMSGNISTGIWMVLTPKVQVSPGITITLTGTNMPTTTFLVDVADDPAAQNQMVVDTTPADITTVTQSVPTASGP